MTRRAFTIRLVLLAAAAVLAACGKKGPLEPPQPENKDGDEEKRRKG